MGGGGEGRGQRACLLGSSVGAEGLPIGPLAAQWSGERFGGGRG